MTLKEYKVKKMQDPEWAKAYEEIRPGMEAIRESMDYKRYEESLARTGEPIPLDTVENIDVRVDVRALQTYANERGVSTLDLTEEERRRFILPRDVNGRK